MHTPSNRYIQYGYPFIKNYILEFSFRCQGARIALRGDLIDITTLHNVHV